jgi:predicted Zn-dependent peptidase
VVPVEETVARIEAVSETDIQSVARKIFRSRPTLASIGPIARVPKLSSIIERLAA